MLAILEDICKRATAIVDLLGPRVTDPHSYPDLHSSQVISGANKDDLTRFGISLSGDADCCFLLPRDQIRIGNINVSNQGKGTVVILNTAQQPRDCNITLRIHGNDCVAMFADISSSPINLPTIFMRSDRQTFFWGMGSTSVLSRVEIEGVGRMVAVGDDCMFSSGVWLRNHDMHCVFDVETGTILNSKPTNMILEQHVWLSFEAFLLAVPTVGFGSIIGARAQLNKSLSPKSLAVGTPAKVIRENVSWSRPVLSVSQSTRERLSHLAKLSPDGQIEKHGSNPPAN